MEGDTVPYEVVKLSPTTRTLPHNVPEILEAGNVHQNLREAAVEATARHLAAGTDGGPVDWKIIEAGDNTRTPVEETACEPEDVYDYLVEHLGVPPDQAERLVE
jgi:hypothetical protein